MTRRLLLLSGLAVFAVVCNHAVGWCYTAMFWWTDTYLPVSVPSFEQLRSPTYYALLIVKRLTVFSVPAFLFISGYFAAYMYGGKEPRKAYKNAYMRITKLLIPYVIWSLAIFTANAVQGTVYTPFKYLHSLTLGAATGAYFYVPVICGLYLLSPPLLKVTKAKPLTTLLLSLALQSGTIAIYYLAIFGVTSRTVVSASRITSQYMLPRLVFFFVLGIVVKLKFRSFSAWLARHRYCLFASLIVSGTAAVLEPEALYLATGMDWLHGFVVSTDLYATAFILCFLAIKDLTIPASRMVLQAGTNSYAIYLIHPMVLEVTARLLRWFAPRLLAHQILFLPLLVTAGIGIPYLMVISISRTPARKYAQYVFG